jgi:hypothetical protein
MRSPSSILIDLFAFSLFFFSVMPQQQLYAQASKQIGLFTAKELKKEAKLIKLVQALKHTHQLLKHQKHEQLSAAAIEIQLKQLTQWIDRYLHQPFRSAEQLIFAKKLWLWINESEHSLLVFKHELWCISPSFYDFLIQSQAKHHPHQLQAWTTAKRLCQEEEPQNHP